MEIADTVAQWAQERGYRVRSHPSTPRNPSIILLGEDHLNLFHQKKQVELVSMLESDVLVHEFARNYILNFVEKKVYVNPKFPTPDSAREFAKGDTAAPYGLLNSRTPLMEWIMTEDIVCSLGNYETAFLALSAYGNFGRFLENRPRPLRCIFGADISHAEQRMYEAENKVSLAGEWGDSPREHQMLRETRMADAISLALSRTFKPVVVAILGNYHVLPESYIHAKLQKQGLEYLYVDQVVRK